MKCSWIPESVSLELPKPLKAPFISSLKVAKLCVATLTFLACYTVSPSEAEVALSCLSIPHGVLSAGLNEHQVSE